MPGGNNTDWQPIKDDIAAGWTPLGLKWLADGAPYGERYLKWRAQHDKGFINISSMGGGVS